MGSQARIATLGKYLVALSPSFPDSSSPRGHKVSGRKKRLHVLYLLNDLLHHTKFNEPTEGFAISIQEFIRPLVITALYTKAEKQLARIERLIRIWEEKQYYPRYFTAELNTVASDVVAGRESTIAPSKPERVSSSTNSKAQPKMVLLPPFHGDPAIPFYDLPAGNLLPHITANVPNPINPRLVRPIQFPHITPDPCLVQAVDEFLSSVDSMFNGKEQKGDPDAVGGFSGPKDGECYYGWSRTFCEKMKEKRNGGAGSGERARDELREGSRGRRRRSYSSYTSSSRSRSPSRSRSRNTRRRETSSSPYSRSRTRSRSGIGPKECSRTRSPSPSRHRPSFQRRQDMQPAQHLVPEQPAPAIVPPPTMHYGYPQQQPQFQPQQQFQMGIQNWPAAPMANASFPPPPHPSQLMQLQQFQQYGYPQLQAGQWQQPQQQFYAQPKTDAEYNYNTGSGESGAGNSVKKATDPRLAKRGWKT